MLILSIRNIKPVDLSCGNSKLTDEKLSPTALSLNPTFSLESIFFCNLVASLCTKFSRVHGILPPYAPLLFLVATVSFYNSQPQILTATPVQSGGLPVTYSGLSAWWRPRWTGFLLCTWPSTHQHPGVEREAGSLLKSQGLHAGALNGWRNLAREKSRRKQAMLKHSCLSLQSNSRSVRQPHISPGWIWDFTCSVSQLSEYAPQPICAWRMHAQGYLNPCLHLLNERTKHTSVTGKIWQGWITAASQATTIETALWWCLMD